MVPTTPLVVTLASKNARASEQKLAQGVGTKESVFAVHDNHNLFDLDNKSAAECLYGKNNNGDDFERDMKLLGFLDHVKAGSNNRYCHTAINTLSELEIAKSKS